MDTAPESGEPSTPAAPAALAFPVVGLGASAGGVEALGTFFDHTTADSGMAFVVKLHLPSGQDSNLPQILRQHTAMPIAALDGAGQLQPNRIYIVPPGAHLVAAAGKLQLAAEPQTDGTPMPIDELFRALADAYDGAASAVVLSGTGSDGSIGLKRIKESGGVTLAQDPQDAQFDGMPRAAMGTGMIDYIVPAASLHSVLLTYWRRSTTVVIPRPDVEPSNADADALREIFSFLRIRLGHDFSQYKRPTMLRRLARRMQVTGVPDLATYQTVLRSRPEEGSALLSDLLISVTNFFRDPQAWPALAAIVPQLFEGKGPEDQIRVWVVACATGEEAYSVAMLLQEYTDTLSTPPTIQVFATDIDDAALDVARKGSYPTAISGDISPERLQRFFVPDAVGYRVKQDLRDRILFAHHNVLREPPFSRVNLVTCRNLLIYLNRDAQEQMFRTFNFALQPQGYLLLGSAEAIDGASQLFSTVDKAQRLFQRRGDGGGLPGTVGNSVGAQQSTPPASVRDAEPPHPAASFGDLHDRLVAPYIAPSVIVNAEGTIVYLGRGAGRFLQFQQGELVPNLLKLILPELRLEVRTAIFSAGQQGGAVSAQKVPVTLDGRQHAINVIVQPIISPDWAAGHFLIMFHDLGETTESISASASTDALVRQLETELDRTKLQLQITIEQYDTAVEEYKAANEELQAINEELRAAGEELETSKEELQSVNEELITLNGELRAKIDEVSRAHTDLQNLISSTQIATLFLDRELHVRRFTPSTQELFNVITADLGRPLEHITHSLRYDRLPKDAAEVLQTLVPITREVQSRSERWYMVRLLPYRTFEDRIDGVVVTLVDITDSKRTEAERELLLRVAEESRAETEAALQIRDQFLSIASHELRTPLTSLIGYAHILQTGGIQDPAAAQRIVETIARQAQRLDTLIDELLDVSRLQQGQFALEREPLDLGALVAQTVEEMASGLPADSPHHLDLVRPAGALMISGDPHRLEQVVQNLIGNAIKYSPDGGPVRVRVRETATEGVLEVEDEGLGIPHDAQKRLFEAFFRAGNVRAQSSGFGLGLHIVGEIVKRHGGHVEVSSVEGLGSTFRVLLPLLGSG